MNLIYIITTAVLCVTVPASPFSNPPLDTVSAGMMMVSYSAGPSYGFDPYLPTTPSDDGQYTPWQPPDHHPEDDGQYPPWQPPGYYPEDETRPLYETLPTDPDRLVNIDFSLQLLVGATLLVLSIAYIWFLVLKPITWFISFF